MRSEGEHAPEQTRASAPSVAPPRAAPRDRLLALQRAAGNRAMGTLVARAPKAKPKPKPAPTLADRRISHIVLSGVPPIEVVSWAWPGGAFGGSEGSNRELQISMRTGALSATVIRAVAEGREFAQAELVWYGPRGGGFRVLLSRVTVTSYQTGPGGGDEAPLETLSLSAQDIKVSMEPGAP